MSSIASVVRSDRFLRRISGDGALSLSAGFPCKKASSIVKYHYITRFASRTDQTPYPNSLLLVLQGKHDLGFRYHPHDLAVIVYCARWNIYDTHTPCPNICWPVAARNTVLASNISKQQIYSSSKKMIYTGDWIDTRHGCLNDFSDGVRPSRKTHAQFHGWLSHPDSYLQ